MSEKEIQSVLRCELCNKPFDKQSTLKRHGYYCRSRRDGVTTRPRSCLPCARAKARCDHRRPQCSRCTDRRIQCHWPASLTRGTGSRIRNSGDADVPAEMPDTTPLTVVETSGVENVVEAGDEVLNNDLNLDWALDLGSVDLGEGYINLDEPYVDLPDLLTNEPLQPNFSASLGSHETIYSQTTPRSTNISVPPVPVYDSRSFIYRPKNKQRITSLIFQTLKSYPLMMLRHKTLPPYIHPHLMHESGIVHSDDMEALHNCVSLVHMVSGGVSGSQKLFWKNVRQECERLRETHSRLNKWELLAGLQALSIYIIIRLDQGETEWNNLDSLLLTIVILLGKRLNEISYDDPGAEIGWTDWIFQESLRRVCVVFQVVNMLVYFDPAAMCSHGSRLILGPLPAKEGVWEAGDEKLWKVEQEKEVGSQKAFGLDANGELVQIAEKGYMHYMPCDTANWGEWFSGMDKFGGLIMMAASLIE